MKSTFRTHLRRRRAEDNQIGDLARDVIADERLKGVRLTPERLMEHLEDCNADPRAIKAAKRAGYEWRDEGW